MRRSPISESFLRTRSTHTRPTMRAGLLVICTALAFAFACEREALAPATPAAPVARPAADAEGRLDPAPYRAEIEATQALLFADAELSEDDWKALSKALLDLHNQIVFHDSSQSAREASGRLFFFSARADVATSARHGEVERSELRDQWQRLCADKFAPADWIRAEPADP